MCWPAGKRAEGLFLDDGQDQVDQVVWGGMKVSVSLCFFRKELEKYQNQHKD